MVFWWLKQESPSAPRRELGPLYASSFEVHVSDCSTFDQQVKMAQDYNEYLAINVLNEQQLVCWSLIHT